MRTMTLSETVATVRALRTSGNMTVSAACAEVGVGLTVYERASRVVRYGVPKLIALMDSNEVSIRTAALIAGQPTARQRRIVALPPRERHDQVRHLYKELTPVKSRNAHLLKQATQQSDRLTDWLDAVLETIAVSPSDRAEAKAAFGRLRERLAAMEAAIDAAPVARNAGPLPRRGRVNSLWSGAFTPEMRQSYQSATLHSGVCRILVSRGFGAPTRTLHTSTDRQDFPRPEAGGTT